MDWTETGASPPTGILPKKIFRVFLLLLSPISQTAAGIGLSPKVI